MDMTSTVRQIEHLPDSPNGSAAKVPRDVIAASLRRERARANLSLTEAARRAGIAKSTLSQLESGAGNPSLETLWALCVALEIPFGRLIDPPRPRVQVIRAGAGPDRAYQNRSWSQPPARQRPPERVREARAPASAKRAPARRASVLFPRRWGAPLVCIGRKDSLGIGGANAIACRSAKGRARRSRPRGLRSHRRDPFSVEQHLAKEVIAQRQGCVHQAIGGFFEMAGDRFDHV